MENADEELEEEIRKEMEWLNSIMHQFEADNASKGRIVFLSAKSRTYFPSDPGTSRFGIAYAMNCAPGDVPNPSYLHSEDRLDKPISNKGYGIGGLSGPRFAKLLTAENPAPNAYYQDWVQPGRSSIINQRKFSKLEAEHRTSNAQDSLKLKQSRDRLRDLCLQTIIGFGSHLSLSRFELDNTKFHNVGVGAYDLNKKPFEMWKQSSFGMKPVKFIQPTLTRCNYRTYDKCFECDAHLQTVDYYRTMTRIKNPFYNSTEIDRTGDLDSMYLQDGIKSASMLNRENAFVSLCRACYCKAKNGESKFWNPKEMSKLFAKTRHCSYIHDHQGIPIFTRKTDCIRTTKLTNKEILLSKYYKDACDKIIKIKY